MDNTMGKLHWILGICGIACLSLALFANSIDATANNNSPLFWPLLLVAKLLIISGIILWVRSSTME